MAKIIVANWKMNGSLAFMETWLPALTPALASTSNQVIICPPFPFLFPLGAALKGTFAHLGAQNCHIVPAGPFTGEVSAAMLADIGCQAVIVGHSERRTLFSETNDLIKAKAEAVHAAGMTAIICIGESLTIRQSGRAIDTVIQQCQASLPPSATPENTRVAYEPLWAIGTGLTASLPEITEMHQALHAATKVPLPYVNGVLVGGTSLKIGAFQKIIG
ncbi:MAG: triose-phosphate isomerase [Alphaproteobacteria bacterium]|nr:triose-phosphate isomerase [Alphaproteobacteria bacterium]